MPMVSDTTVARNAIQIFADPNDGFELMALKSGQHRTYKGADLDKLCEAVSTLPSGIGIYFRVNPVGSVNKPANNTDVTRRRWLYIDVDPVKPEEQKDNPATDDEKSATSKVCDQVNEYLTPFGWSTPVIVDSGNGYGLFYRCDLPNDKLVQASFRKLLALLAEKFTGPNGIIDKSVHNANRLAKLPGTWARKGTQSADRPHRPCKFHYIPDVIEAVTAEQLAQAAGGVEPEKPRPEKTYTAPPAGAEAPYGRKALDAECARVALARGGADDGRNNALNRAAFSLGQLVAGGVLLEEIVYNRLYDVAIQAGLEERETRLTIQSGLEAGKKEARGVPVKNDPKAKFEQQKTEKRAKQEPGERLTVKMSAVTPLEVQWLVKNRIPKGFITVMAGRTAIGKSYVCCDLVARLSKGAEIPFSGGECFKPGGTLIVSEDSHEYVLAPRLIDADTNMDRVHAMTWKAMNEYHLSDTDMLTRACDEIDGGVSLVMIDPPTNFLEGTDEHKNSEVRQLVMKVVEWSLVRGVAVLFILHVNKQANGVEALNRVMGSVAWVTTARVAHTFCSDPDDKSRAFWLPTKNNLGPLCKGIAYRIASHDGATKVEWIEEIDTTADEAMNSAEPRKRRDVAAGEWLIERFKEKLEWESGLLMERAKVDGVSRNAIFEAKDSLGLPRAKLIHKENGDRTFVWWVPFDWEHFPKPTVPPAEPPGQWDSVDGKSIPD